MEWGSQKLRFHVGIITVIMVLKRKREGIYQGQYYIGIFVIGITVLILGVILLIVSFITDLSLFYALYLIVVGALAVIIGLVIRNIWEKNR